MRRPLVSLLPKAQPYPSPFAATPFFLLLSPSASLPRGTEVLPTHTLFLYHHFLLPLPLPPAFTSCFCFTSGQLGKIWAPRTHNHRGADLLLWDTWTGPLGEGQKASLPASSVLYPGSASRGQPLAHRRGGLARVRDRGQWQSAASSPVHLKRTE